jgi:hypothetical protein
MGVGPNYVLNKGMLAQGTSAYTFGELVIDGSVEQSVARATSAGADVSGVVQETVDATRVTTGKVFVNVAYLGMVRVLTGAAVAKRDRLTNDTSARAVPSARTAAGSQPKQVFGIALTAATGANQYIDVLLTPGGSY